MLIVAAFFIKSLYQPEFIWKVSALSAEDGTESFDMPETVITGLYENPFSLCIGYVEISYIHNQLREQRTIIEENTRAVEGLFAIVFLASMSDIIVLTLSLFVSKRIKPSLGNILGSSFIAFFICAFSNMIMMYLGPTNPGVGCVLEYGKQFELMNISYNGMPYLYISIAIALSAICLVFVRYVFYGDMLFKPKSVQD
jgi:hypothetical protein